MICCRSMQWVSEKPIGVFRNVSLRCVPRSWELLWCTRAYRWGPVLVKRRWQLPPYIYLNNALTGEGVNSCLAFQWIFGQTWRGRDGTSLWVSDLSIGVPFTRWRRSGSISKRAIWPSDIIYTTIAVSRFDYLVMSGIEWERRKFLRPFNYAIIGRSCPG